MKNVTKLTQARFEQLGYEVQVTEQVDGTLSIELLDDECGVLLVLPRETIGAIYRTFKCGAFA